MSNTADFIQRAGRTFRSQPLTPDEEEIVLAAIGRKRFHMLECFYNAQRVVLADKTRSLL